MKIVTQNIEFLFDEGKHTHSGAEWTYTKDHVDARIEYFADLFATLDADIILLQEIASQSVVERIIARSGIAYSYFAGAPDQNGVGNAVLYRDASAVCVSVPAVASLPVFVEGDPDTLGARMWSRRDFVHVQTTWNEKPLDVIGIHIKANFLVPERSVDGVAHNMETQRAAGDGLIRSEIFRFSQAKRVRALVDEIFFADPEAQIVVAGDFNAEEYDSVFRIIRGVAPDVPDALTDACSSIALPERFSSLSSMFGRKRLPDHVLLSKALVSHLDEVQILNERIAKNTNVAPNPTLIGSDHAPVVITLKG